MLRRETDRSAGGAAALPPFPEGEQPFQVVHACGRAGKEKGATSEPVTPS